MATSSGYHVIVGGLGALGKTLQRTLLAHGKKVRVLDLHRPVETLGRLVDSSVEYHQCHLPIVHEHELKNVLKDAETVYGLATGDVLHATAADMNRTNEHATRQLLKVCKQVGVPKFVHASSYGVTNQMLDHFNEDETVPLPSWDTYKIPYDISKRRGEELVLEANDNDNTGNFQTVSLRLGMILADPTDNVSRAMIEKPDAVPVYVDAAPTDYISARDVSRAMLKASDKLDHTTSSTTSNTDTIVAGRALFLTKSKDDRGFTNSELAELYAELLHWQTVEAKPWKLRNSIQAAYAKASLKSLFVTPTDENTAACPSHLLLYAMLSKNHTYDNSLVKRLLDYEPEDTVEDIITSICADIRLESPELFILNPHKL